MMMDFGWKAKAERLRMTILSGAHQLAKELHPTIAQTMELFARAATSGDGSTLQKDIANLTPVDDSARLLWEPASISGWEIQAAMYRKDGALWWLVRAVRKHERVPSEKDNVLLDKVLGHLGAEPTRHLIIGPRSSPPGHEPLFFGWWTWKNHHQLYDIQIKGKGKAAQMRIVPLGSRATEGFESLDLSEKSEPKS